MTGYERMMKPPYYSEISRCRSCGANDFRSCYEVAPIPVAGIYYDKSGQPTDVRAPMTLLCCRSCGLVQLKETINPDIYQEYSFVGNSAAGYEQYLKGLATELSVDWDVKGKQVFEIGANNGILLGYLSKIGGNDVSGVEPSRKLCDEANASGVRVHRGYFNAHFADQHMRHTFDCVIIRHVLEHIHDLNETVRAVKRIMKADALLVVEVPDIESIVKENIFSNIFHEHLSYFSFSSLNHLMARHGFAVVRRKNVETHGGSLLLVYRAGASGQQSGALTIESLDGFSAKARAYYTAVRNAITSLVGEGNVVHGYGASHRTFILLGNAGLDVSTIPVIYDNNRFLHNKRLNGLHSLVKPKESLREGNPGAVVIFASSYEDEIRRSLKNDFDFQGRVLSVRYERIVRA
jgi:2-polyprenyl-3-methyl-5-hydroxy-6-metoxy-1,4-benzoquinol methylase